MNGPPLEVAELCPEEMREVTGTVLPWPAEALADLLGVNCPDFAGGETLPLGWHWLYLLDHPRQEELGSDGHPVSGVFPTPPAPGLRRMWAGGALTRIGPLRVGEETTRRSRMVESTTKRGRSGVLFFQQVEHELSQGGAVAVRERQDIVYRERPAPNTSPEPVPVHRHDIVRLEAGDWSIPVTSSLLFRFSALTYNAHRIHYDRDYARTVEGYPGLVTHGPLQALLMAEGFRNHMDSQRGHPGVFEYRMTAPLFDHQGLVVRWEIRDDASVGVGGVAEVRDLSGRRTARGTYRFL